MAVWIGRCYTSSARSIVPLALRSGVWGELLPLASARQKRSTLPSGDAFLVLVTVGDVALEIRFQN